MNREKMMSYEEIEATIKELFERTPFTLKDIVEECIIEEDTGEKASDCTPSLVYYFHYTPVIEGDRERDIETWDYEYPKSKEQLYDQFESIFHELYQDLEYDNETEDGFVNEEDSRYSDALEAMRMECFNKYLTEQVQEYKGVAEPRALPRPFFNKVINKIT